MKLACCEDVELRQRMAAEQKIFANLHQTIREQRAALRKQLTGDGVEQVVSAVLNALSESEGSLMSALESGTLQLTIGSIVRPVAQAEAHRVVAEAVAEFNRRIERTTEHSDTQLDVQIAIMSPQMKEESSGTMESVIGALIGAAILGPLGAFTGAFLGKFFGNNKDEVAAENRTLIHSQVIPAVLASIRQQVALRFAEYADKIADSTQSFVDEQRRSLEARREQMLVNIEQKRQEFEVQQQLICQAIAAIDNPELLTVFTAEEAQHG